MKKRIFSLLLCIVMCLSLFPMSAFAEVTPAEMAFRFQVTVNGNEPSDEEFGKFTFYFDELKRPGLSNPWENLRTAENGSINGSGDINFRSLGYSYGDEGTHWYRFYEDQEKIKDYTLDQTVFYLKVVIIEDGVGADTEFRIYETRAYKAPFGADVYDNAGVVDQDKLTAIALDDMVFANTYAALYETTVDSSIKNGAVTVDKATCASGEIVTLTATPADGYEFDSWNVTDKNGDPVTVNEQNQFTMPESDVTVKATFVMNLETAKEYTKNAIDELVPADASDELKAAAEKAKAAVDAAKTMDEIDAACDEFSKAYDLLEYKEERIASFEEALNSDEYSDAFKALVEEMMDAVKAADSKEAIDAIGEEYSPRLDLQYDKDEACAAIEELLPNDPSDAVKKIASDACDKIQASDDSTGFDSFVNETRLAIEAQLQKEAELAPAKEAAIAEINKAKTDANASVAEDAVKAINDATTVDEVNKRKERALADMAKADAAAELDAAKKSAIDTINAYKSDVNASVADAAIADINNATTAAEVSNIVNQTIPKLLGADRKAEFKEKITNELLPAAKCDEAKAILNKALTDLDDAVTLDEVNTVFYNAQGQANGQDGAFTGMLAGYSNAFNSAITDVATDETKAFVSEMLKALDEATSIARINEIYNSNKDKISVCINRDKNVADFNKYIDSDEYSDEMKAIAREAIEKLMQAESVSDVEKITNDYKLKLDVQEDKETTRKVLASDEYSDEMKALAQNALDELDDVTTSQELTNLWDKYNPLMRLQLAKDAARKEVKELLPKNASDAVKKIVSDACDEIQENDDPNKYADIIEAARQAIEAQLQKEKELAPAKEAAIAEINDAKTDANATVAENAIKAINDATTVDEVNKLKEQALTDMAKADATAELIAAKEEAKAAIDKAVPTNASDAVAAVAENTKAAIDKANSIEDVNAAKEAGIAAIKKQIAADIAAAELLETKEAAKKAIDDAVPADASNEVKAAAEAAKNDIDAATTTDAVNTAKENGLTAIDDQIAADKLAEAKETAKKAILAEQGDDTAENVAKASRDAIAAIDAATTVDAVNAEKNKGVEAIRAAKEANKPVSYTIITGADSTWTKGSTDVLLVRSNAPFAKFVSVKVDGAVVAASNYIAEEGSTIIKLKPAYLETLKLGKHSIEILSADGSASTYFTINAKSDPTSPKTGDNSNMFLWITLLFISSGALVGTAVYGKKKKYRAE